MRTWVLVAVLLGFAGTLQGCGKLFGGLRKDFDDGYRDQYTTGGVWPERQMLDEADLEAPSAYEDYDAVGHSERQLAGNWSAQDPSRSWVRGESYPGTERIRPPEELIQQEQRMAARAQDSARKFKNGSRATRADFIDESQSEGSLWASGGQTNYFFTKNSVKSPGDIITVKAEDHMIRDVAVEVKRNLTEDEMEEEIALMQKKKLRGLASAGEGETAGAPAAGTDQAKSSAASAKSANPNDIFAESSEEAEVTPADIDLSKEIGMKSGETVMAEIVERYPSGNYKIRGTKRLNYRGSVRMLTFVAIARAADIGEGDSIDSSKLYEYKLNVQR